ncbi:MAG: MFS transporter [Actinomycetota bacterium]|nr:MFS transporter [Actinomycetota bacterium]
MTGPSEAVSAEAPNPRRWLILAVVATAQLMVVLDVTIVNIALPSAQRALGFANSDRQWIVTAYALAFGSLLLLGGRIGDLFGRKWAFIVGLAGFAGASAVGGAANSFGMLVAARALQGVFGAVLAPSALSTLATTFTTPAERGKAFGIFGAVAGGGSAVGLVLGGVLTEDLSWRWCLYVNLFFAAIAGIGALALLQNRTEGRRPRLDLPGTLLASAGLLGIVYGFSHAATASWGNGLTVGSLLAGVGLLAVFVIVEQRVAHPLLPLRIIVDRNRGGSYLSVAFSAIAIFGVFLFLTFYLQQIKGYSPIITGLGFLPLTAAIITAATLSNIKLLPRLGPRPLVVVGMLCGSTGMLLLSRLGVGSRYVAGILPAMVVLGLGFGFIFAPAINEATAGVAPRDAGVASAMVNTMQQVGGSVGTALLSTLAAGATTTYLRSHHGAASVVAAKGAVHGYTVAFLTSAAIFGVGAVVAGALLNGRPVPASSGAPEPVRA